MPSLEHRAQVYHKYYTLNSLQENLGQLKGSTLWSLRNIFPYFIIYCNIELVKRTHQLLVLHSIYLYCDHDLEKFSLDELVASIPKIMKIM